MDRSQKFEVRNPQDNSLIDVVPRAGAADMRAAIAAAVVGFERARRLPAHRRMAILREAADRLAEEHEAVARTIALEEVKTIREARKEATRCLNTLRLSAEEAGRLHGETVPFDQTPSGEKRVGYYSREPIGIIGAITPFNDPLNLVAHKVGPAIAAGNAIIVKPDSKTPLSVLRLGEAIHRAGLPTGILQGIRGDDQ